MTDSDKLTKAHETKKIQVEHQALVQETGLCQVGEEGVSPVRYEFAKAQGFEPE